MIQLFLLFYCLKWYQNIYKFIFNNFEINTKISFNLYGVNFEKIFKHSNISNIKDYRQTYNLINNKITYETLFLENALLEASRTL
jgi:hypothetical protein